MYDSSAYELILEEGGVREAQRILLLQGRQVLGTPDEATVEALKSIKDLDRLERLASHVFKMSSWQELLATL